MAALKDMGDTGCAYNLYNRFVEVMIVVGIDENTGLIPADKDAEVCLCEYVLKKCVAPEYSYFGYT